jgi:hypothetical protein
MEAHVKWEEMYLDDKGQPIIDDTVATREIISHISNSNVVTMEGIVIDSENFPKLDEESDEEYTERFEGIKATGIPEFDFYIGAVLNVQAIGQAIQILDQLKRFNRK